MFKHDYADVNGVRLHYVTTGEGPLVLFLHGFPEFWYAWRDQLEEFGQDHQAVAVDLRGYNLSSKPVGVEQYRVRYLVQDVVALSAWLGHARFTLVGHDWGGVVAWAFAAAHPERLERLIIINSPHPNIFERELRESPAQQEASRYMLMFRTPKAEEILSADNYLWLVRNVLSDGLERGHVTELDRSAYLEAWSQPGALAGGLNYYRASAIGPQAATNDGGAANSMRPVRPAIIRVPTLVIWGEQDKALLSGNLVGLEAFVPNLRVKRIPDGSHWVVHEHPALINALIREFIQGN
jgi:pimeloyl-ACP methyl ester carboxylesterase